MFVLRSIAATILALGTFAGLSPASAQQRMMMVQGRVVPHYDQRSVSPRPVATLATAARCVGSHCETRPLSRNAPGPVVTTCTEAMASAALRTQSDGGKIAIIPARGGGYCVKTRRGVFHYLKGGESVTDLATGQKCTRWKTSTGLSRLFWVEGGVVKSRVG